MPRNRSEKDTAMRRYMQAWLTWDAEFQKPGPTDHQGLMKLARATDALFRDLTTAQKGSIYGMDSAERRIKYSATQ